MRNYLLHKVKGKDVLSCLTKQVRSRTWQFGKVQNFYIKGKKNPVFKITPIPTLKQPGNGKIEFRQPGGSYKAPTYHELKRTIKNQNFPKHCSEWKKRTLNKANFQTKTAQANLLLEFEVARRSCSRGGSLSGSQTSRAISTVTNPRKKRQSYPKQVFFSITN